MGGNLDLAGKDSAGDLDAVYYDGVIANSSCVDMTSTRFATANLDKAVESFTFASWIYLPSEYASRSSYTTLFSIGVMGTVESFVHTFFEAAGGKYNFCIWVGETGAVATQIETDKWYHVGWTYDAAAKASKVYLDGALVYDQVMTTSYTGIPENTPFYIGHQSAQALFTDTLIDETVFAPSVWSETQIKALHSDPAAAAESLSDAFKPAATPDTTPDTGDFSSGITICLFAIILASAAAMIILSKKKSF